MKLRATVALVVAMLAAMFFIPAAQAAPAPGYPPHGCPGQLSVSTTHPLPGETITVTGSNFTANAQVHLVMHTKTYDLGTFTANAQGQFAAQVQLPNGVTGRHVIFATSGAAHIKQCAGIPIQIHSPAATSAGPGPHHGNAFTGVDILLILLVAAGLLGAGVALTRGGKRRHGAGTN